MRNSPGEFFGPLISALWLRPESALWYAHMLHAAAKFGVAQLNPPNLEFGCMDGLNTFTLFGGVMAPDFDVFDEVSWSRNSHKGASLKDDYYNISSGTPRISSIIHPAKNFFTHGLDWKQSHLDKATRYGVYKHLYNWAPGTPLAPYATHSINSIWAPNLYWVNDLDGLLAEFKRVLCTNGTLYTIAPDLNVLDTLIYRFHQIAPSNWIADLDRGRHENATAHAKTLLQWESKFSNARFSLSRHDKFIPDSVGRMYEIGLRPMFSVFMNMYEKLARQNPAALHELKKSWVETVTFLIAPFLDLESGLGHKTNYLWHIFELSPVP